MCTHVTAKEDIYDQKFSWQLYMKENFEHEKTFLDILKDLQVFSPPWL
jgi:hypothetical protein